MNEVVGFVNEAQGAGDFVFVAVAFEDKRDARLVVAKVVVEVHQTREIVMQDGLTALENKLFHA